MINIHNPEQLDPLQVLQVQEDMQRKGINHYTMTPGNQCIWVYYGQVNLYYIFQDTKIVDIQID